MRKIGGIRIPDDKDYKVRCTQNYRLFKTIEGNRNLDHVNKIIKSIQKVGLFVQPILVNQRMEIIDGQHRFSACRELGLPVYYIIQDDIGLKEVKALNMASKNWSTKNYIHSYAAGNNSIDYIYLEQIMKAYPWATVKIVGCAFQWQTGGGIHGKIKDGEFKCTTEQYQNAIKALDYVDSVREQINTVTGSKEHYLFAIVFCYFCELVDNDYLLKKINKYYRSLDSATSIKSAMMQIESKVYNYQMRTPMEPVSISIEYEKAVRAKKQQSRRQS